MGSQEDQEFSKFETLLGKWCGGYGCAIVAYVGLKSHEGAGLMSGRVLFQASRVGLDIGTFRFETEHVIAGRYVDDATSSRVSAHISKAKNGEIICIDRDASLRLDRDNSLSVFFAPIHHPLITDGPRLPSLLIRGGSRHSLLSKSVDPRQIDWELRAADIPFDNLDELLIHCGLSTLSQMGDAVILEIVARSPAMIGGGSTIKEREAVIECHAGGGLVTHDVKLGYKIFKKDTVNRGNVDGTAFEWRSENDIQIGTCKIPVGDATVLQAFLSYAETSLHQWWVTDPQKRLNPRHAIHQIFDDDNELLKQMLLKPDTDKPYAFENAVSALLNLLGFSVSNYERIPKLQKGPDIVALCPAGHVGVVECTVGLLDENDKLAKLVQRTKLIRDKLNQTGYVSLQVQPVIVTPLSRDEVTANLETAGKHDIAVVCKENLEAMLNRISLPPNADGLFQEAKRLVPSSGQDNLFGDKS